MACATLLCYLQLSQNAQDISNQIQQQQRTAEGQAMACATQWCHDQIMTGLADGAYNVVAAGPDLVTSDGHSITTATPKAVLQAAATPAPKPAQGGGCHGFWGCTLHIAAKYSGVQAAIDCVHHATFAGCTQAAVQLTLTVATIYTGGTLLAARFSVGAAEAEADAGVSFIANSNGEVVRVPEGATGPIPADSGKGFQFTGGSGGAPLDSRVASVRIMEPVTTGKYPHPNGYVSYFNESGQTVNPFTGSPQISRSDPLWHWDWSP
jgi:hypothetical protein